MRSYDTAPPQMIGLTVISGTLLILALAKFNRKFRDSFNAIATEQLICWHAIRAPIGAAFLVMASEEMMPDLFAKRAGYGDIFIAITGVLAVAIIATMSNNKLTVPVYLVWNILGLVDLLLAVGTGIYLALHIPDSMIWIARLPLLLVPTFILPVLFATHFIMIGRLIRSFLEKQPIGE